MLLLRVFTFTLEDFLDPSRKACQISKEIETLILILQAYNTQCALTGFIINSLVKPDLLSSGRGSWRLFITTLFAFFISLLIANAPSSQGDGGRRVLEGGVEL